MNAIETRALRKVYPAPAVKKKRGVPLPPAPARGGIVAIDALDLAVAEGEFFGVLGPNGAGKTTLIGILTTRMFGCTYYPWAGLTNVPLMKWLVLINPLVYVSEGMRAALTPGVPHMPIALILAALVALTVLFLCMGLKAFDKRAMS